MNAESIWIVAGAAVVAVEILPRACVAWFGLAAVATGLIALAVPLSLAGEAGVFAFGALIAAALCIGLRRWSHDVPAEDSPAAWLVGKRVRALGFDGHEGRVRIDESDWPARLLAGQAARDAMLTVIAVDGATLLVCPEPRAAS